MHQRRLHRGHRELAADQRTGEQVVVARALAQRVEVHRTARIAREGQPAADVEQRLEAQFVARSLIDAMRSHADLLSTSTAPD
ncbi:hypothetical protein [Aquabacterium humicola]|uniref:hypothetical protein n=1 Tax=Aquabacterium humicola TaxID=3237377 RepID=UPI0032EB4280